jgi:hypothetical protein
VANSGEGLTVVVGGLTVVVGGLTVVVGGALDAHPAMSTEKIITDIIIAVMCVLIKNRVHLSSDKHF